MNRDLVPFPSGTHPRILVAGCAACLDLIFSVDRYPAPSDVANLLPNPASENIWLDGGSALTVALAAHRQGVPVSLWHPIPKFQYDRYWSKGRIAGIDLSRCPKTDQPPARCVLVYDGIRRSAWTTTVQSDDLTIEPAILENISHIIITPKWGQWTTQLLKLAAVKQIPCSLVGEVPPDNHPFDWNIVVLDANQWEQAKLLKSKIRVVTHGEEGAVVTALNESIRIPAISTVVVDSTGAGDVFGGTLISHLVREPLRLREAGEEAAKMASFACESWGAQSWFRSNPQAVSSEGKERVLGALWGLACGDAFGMPNSFLRTPKWLHDLEPAPPDNPYHAGYSAGQITDDTEQALALTKAIAAGRGKPTPDLYAKHLLDWFHTVGGSDSLAVGPSTKRALAAYEAGTPISLCGINGTTNGAAMRITPIGILAALRNASVDELVELVTEACMPTHFTSPAIAGAAAIAGAVFAAIRGASWQDIFNTAMEAAEIGTRKGRWVYAPSVPKRIELARNLVSGARSEEEVVALVSQVIGAGEPTVESIPAALAIADYAGGDPRTAITIAGNVTGDSDTVAAMAGAVCGAFRGELLVPDTWKNRVSEINNLDLYQWAQDLYALS
jgi:ADP-ribosylglycohydrolase/sugar/nucleoside kinase (ribokinase family)